MVILCGRIRISHHQQKKQGLQGFVEVLQFHEIQG